uniref:acyltransferase domain-containing protein n=1 Tax=Streptomyces shenzhenensis TaxID=943815 RepID=UPI001F3A7CE4
ETDPGLPLTDTAHTLATTRALLPHRAVVLADDRDHAINALHALAENRPTPHLITGLAGPTGRGPVFVFPGQGSQWAGMARDLYTHEPAFRTALNTCAQALDPLTHWPLIPTLTGTDDTWLHHVDKVQPALFAVMTSLAHLWTTNGIHPAAVIGHSQGEIAAAHIAGILTLNDAAHIITTRSTAMRHLTGHGGMATINTNPHHIQQHLTDLDATIAAHNSPTTTVITGTPQALDQLTTRCHQHGLHLRRINVDYASHSPQVDAHQQEILQALTHIHPQPAQIPMISTVTGQPVQGPELNATYWYTNLRQPVLFHQALTHLINTGHHTTIETSPHPVLTPAIQETGNLTTLYTLRRGQGAPSDF